MKKRVLSCVILSSMALHAAAQEGTPPAATALPEPVKMTTQEDHQRMMKLLNITSLRPGRNGMNPQAENYANYDESKANPFPTLPDPLVLKNGRRVTSADLWWQQRRPEIVEDFDREIYGRVPQNMPEVTWEVVSSVEGTNGDIPIITKGVHQDTPVPNFIAVIGVRLWKTWQGPVNITGWPAITSNTPGRSRGMICLWTHTN